MSLNAVNRSSAIAILVLVVLLICGVLLLSEIRDASDAPSSELQEKGDTTSTLRSENPYYEQKSGLDLSKLQASVECVDDSGRITCGDYVGREILYVAALVGSTAVIERFLEPQIVESQGNKALNAAAALGDVATIELLLENMSERQATGPSIDFHPAVSAAANGQVEVLELFVSRGLDVNGKFSDGYTDLFVEALVGRQAPTIDYLLENGYSVNCEFRFPNGKSYSDVAQELSMQSTVDSLRVACPSKD